MKILIFNWRDPKHPQAGGGEIYLHQQAKYWIEQGCTVDWVSARFAGGGPHEVLDGLNIHRCGGKFSVYLLAPFKYLSLKKPDILIDVENGIPFFTPLFSRAPKLLVIYHIHKDVWRQEFRRPLAAIGDFLETRVMPLIYRNCSIVTISESSKSMVRELFRKNQISIVNTAISNSLCPKQKSERPEIIFVGRLKRYKSVDLLLRAMQRLEHLDVKLHVVGRGDDEPRLRALAAELGLRNINFTGYLEEDQKLALLQQAWILVNPSIMEGWGISNIEANACGTPSIGANVPGIRDSIRNNESGLLFEHGNVDELASKIASLLEDEAERQRLAEGGLRWARNFSWEKSAQQNLDLIRSIVDKKQTRTPK